MRTSLYQSSKKPTACGQLKRFENKPMDSWEDCNDWPIDLGMPSDTDCPAVFGTADFGHAKACVVQVSPNRHFPTNGCKVLTRLSSSSPDLGSFITISSTIRTKSWSSSRNVPSRNRVASEVAQKGRGLQSIDGPVAYTSPGVPPVTIPKRPE